MLSVENVCKSIGALTLNGISFEARVGSYIVLLGASGVGKSVLLETIAGLIQPDSGRILLEGKDITNERMQRRGVGLVFQDGALFPHRTVFGNIAYPLRWKKLPSRTIRQRVAELAEETGVTALLKRSCPTLSGGEIQRVSLARALAAEPRCLLLDEPLSSLDPKARAQMRGLLRKIHRRGKHAIVHVTHDYTEAVALATRVAVMEHGTIVQTGTVDETFRRPNPNSSLDSSASRISSRESSRAITVNWQGASEPTVLISPSWPKGPLEPDSFASAVKILRSPTVSFPTRTLSEAALTQALATTSSEPYLTSPRRRTESRLSSISGGANLWSWRHWSPANRSNQWLCTAERRSAPASRPRL